MARTIRSVGPGQPQQYTVRLPPPGPPSSIPAPPAQRNPNPQNHFPSHFIALSNPPYTPPVPHNGGDWIDYNHDRDYYNQPTPQVPPHYVPNSQPIVSYQPQPHRHYSGPHGSLVAPYTQQRAHVPVPTYFGGKAGHYADLMGPEAWEAANMARAEAMLVRLLFYTLSYTAVKICPWVSGRADAAD